MIASLRNEKYVAYVEYEEEMFSRQNIIIIIIKKIERVREIKKICKVLVWMWILFNLDITRNTKYRERKTVERLFYCAIKTSRKWKCKFILFFLTSFPFPFSYKTIESQQIKVSVSIFSHFHFSIFFYFCLWNVLWWLYIFLLNIWICFSSFFPFFILLISSFELSSKLKLWIFIKHCVFSLFFVHNLYLLIFFLYKNVKFLLLSSMASSRMDLQTYCCKVIFIQ